MGPPSLMNEEIDRSNLPAYKRGPPQEYLDALIDKKKIEEVHIYVCVCVVFLCVCMHAYMPYVCMSTCIYTVVSVCVHVCMHVCIHECSCVWGMGSYPNVFKFLHASKNVLEGALLNDFGRKSVLA